MNRQHPIAQRQRDEWRAFDRHEPAYVCICERCHEADATPPTNPNAVPLCQACADAIAAQEFAEALES